jgi:hypothetical protein
MKSLVIGSYTLRISAAAAMLAGCGGSQPPIGAPGTMPQSALNAARLLLDHNRYKILYGFKGVRNGRSPTASLVIVNGTLYGTTEFGGSGSCNYTFDRGRADFRGNTRSGVVRCMHYLMRLSLVQVRSFDSR